MTTINLSYNFGTRECTFSDGSRNKDDFLEARKGKELSQWCGEFLGHLTNAYNDEISLDFSGIERDCDTMKDAVDEFNSKSEKKINIKCRILRSQDSATGAKIEKLRSFYNELTSAECPFDEIRNDKNIENAFNKALNTEFEIAVTATMSSGKSTLINSMLGKELLPARNEATTATIARIHDDDNATDFWGEAFDKEGNQIGGKYEPLTSEEMENLNSNPDVSDIEIHGNIVGISSQNMKLVLIDTPGPNNSQNQEHQTRTYKIIENSTYKPMVLYVLNATQLGINDDDYMLSKIAKAMKQNGRQASDRFIFVLNKADAFDTEKESVEKKIEDTKAYLKKHEIENPKVFPCSAYLAKLIRQSQSGAEFTRKQKVDLQGNIGLFIDEKELHFSDMAPISENVRTNLSNALAKAKSTNDERAEALIYTGVPAVEGAISEYLEKYAQPQKITEALHSFMQTIEDLHSEQKETSLLKNNRAKVEETKAAIAKIKTLLEKGEKGKQLKDKVAALNVDDELKNAFEKLSGNKTTDFIYSARQKYCANGDKVTREETKERLGKIQKDFETFGNEFAVDIENLINEKIGGQAEKYASEYNSYVSELLGSAFGHEVKAASILGNLATMKLDSSNIEEFEFNVKEKTGTYLAPEKRTRTEMRTKQRTGTREKKGFFSGVARFFGDIFNKDWGYEDYTYTEEVPVEVTYEVTVQKDKFENRTYVNFKNMFNNLVAPKLDEFKEQARKLTFDEAKNQEDELKNAFMASFDALDKKIAEKLDEQQRTLNDEAELEKKVAESQRKLAWLDDFKKRLNEMLSE